MSKRKRAFLRCTGKECNGNLVKVKAKQNSARCSICNCVVSRATHSRADTFLQVNSGSVAVSGS
jgi:phosphopantetheinyl transferase